MEKNHDLGCCEHCHENHNEENKRPNKVYKWFFTIIFVPFCLFAISHYIQGQIAIRGSSYIGFDMYNDAIREYKKAVFLDKKDITSWSYIGYSYRMIHDYDNAIKAYKALLEVDPQNLTATQDLAMSYALKGDYKEAISVFKTLIDMVKTSDRLDSKTRDKNLEIITKLIVTCYEKLGDLDNARLVLQEYLKDKPNSAKIRDKLLHLGHDH